MRPIPIVLALTLLCGLLWTVLRGESNDTSPVLPTLAAPSAVNVERGEGYLAEVAQEEVLRRGADAPESPAYEAAAAEVREPLVDPAVAGVLEVQVVALESGQPVAGANVQVFPQDGGDGARAAWLGGDPTQPPATDESGVARFHLTPEVAFQLWGSVPNEGGLTPARPSGRFAPASDGPSRYACARGPT